MTGDILRAIMVEKRLQMARNAAMGDVSTPESVWLIDVEI